MPKGQRHLLIGGLVLLDAAAIAVAVVAAYRLTAASAIAWEHIAPLTRVLSIVIPLAIGLFALNRLYSLDELLESPVEYGRILYACTLMAFSWSVLSFWGRDLSQMVLGETARSRTLVASLWLFSVLAAGGGRFLARRVVRALRRRDMLVSRALIVGLGTPGISLARHFQDLPHAGIRVVGFIDDFLAPGTPVTKEWKVLGAPSALPRILEQTGATEVIVVPTAMAWESFQNLIGTVPGLNGHAIRLASGFRDILATSVRVHHFGFMPLLTVERVRITGFDALLKRILDFGLAVLLLPFVATLAGALIAIGRVNRQAALRTVPVLQRGGGSFNALLLDVGVEGRQTAFQHLLYQLGWHRLPQLLNVLRGQMSMVGPRPIPLEYLQNYERWLPNLRTVKPGLMGPWVARQAPGSVDEEMQTNLFYIRNYSVWLDLQIIARSMVRLLADVPLAASRERSIREAARRISSGGPGPEPGPAHPRKVTPQ